MKQTWIIALSILLAGGIVSLALAQGGPFFPFYIGGQGIAGNISQCPAPQANYAFLCPVAGVGWQQSVNGGAYASLTGASATVAVGTVSTLPAGSSATVANAGTASAAVFNFGIPQGSNGNPGPNWTNCPKADLSSTSGLTVDPTTCK